MRTDKKFGKFLYKNRKMFAPSTYKTFVFKMGDFLEKQVKFEWKNYLNEAGLDYKLNK